jgi:hypothetical protein
MFRRHLLPLFVYCHRPEINQIQQNRKFKLLEKNGGIKDIERKNKQKKSQTAQKKLITKNQEKYQKQSGN